MLMTGHRTQGKKEGSEGVREVETGPGERTSWVREADRLVGGEAPEDRSWEDGRWWLGSTVPTLTCAEGRQLWRSASRVGTPQGEVSEVGR